MYSITSLVTIIYLYEGIQWRSFAPVFNHLYYMAVKIMLYNLLICIVIVVDLSIVDICLCICTLIMIHVNENI